MRKAQLAVITAFSAALLMSGCANEVTGPEPALGEVEPPVVCNGQVNTEVTLTGSELSPLPVGTLTDEAQGVLPEITLTRALDIDGSSASGGPVTIPDDPADPANSHVRWHSQESLSFDVFPELVLETGLYGITATNANGNAADLSESLLAVPPPTLAAIDADILCGEKANTLTLTGDFFIRWRGAEPTVAFLDQSTVAAQLAVTTMADCRTLPGTSGAEACETITVDIPADTLGTSAAAFKNFDVIVHNPDNVPCASTESVVLTIVPSPTLATIEPDLVCLEQGARQVRLTGTGFLDIAGAAPALLIGTQSFTTAVDAGTCINVTGPNDTVVSCSEITATIAEDALTSGGYEVVVQNPTPADCSTSEAVRFRVEPRPSVTTVVPDLMCNAEGDRSLTVSGSGFIVVHGTTDTLPSVTIDTETYSAATATDCTAIADTTLTASTCTTLTVTVPEDAIGAGSHAVSVTNPQPAGCFSEEAVTLAIVPEPTVVSAEPDLFCTEGAGRSVTITGTGFVRIPGVTPLLPTVYFGATPVPVTSATICTTIAGSLLAAEACTTLSVTVPPGTVATGDHLLTVENPAPAGCTSNETVSLRVVDAPVIDSIEPSAICTSNQPASMTVAGSGFLRVDDSGLIDPVVTLGGSPIAVTWIGCTTWTGTGANGETCTGFTFPVTSAFAEGTYTVEVTNPTPADCSTSIDFGVAPAPTVTEVTPFKICGEGDTFDVTGSGFVAGSQILLDDGTVYEPFTTFNDTDSLTGEILDGAVPAGVYDVTAENGAGCEATSLPNALQVVDEPTLFFVDPPNVYNGVDMRITVWVSGIEGTAPLVLVRPTGTSDAPIALAGAQFDDVNKVQATVTAGLLPPGDYDVIIQDLCEAELASVLHVTEELSVSVTGITPEFGVSSTDPSADDTVDNTGVSVFSDTADTTFDNFVKTPRVYLNPVGTANPATEMKAVQWLNDPGQLNGIIPAALSSGEYQVIVINPNGGVGISLVNFRMLPNDDPPPVITSLNPGKVRANAAQPVQIVGHHFPADAANLAVSGACLDPTPDGGFEPEDTLVDLDEAGGRITVTTNTATLIESSWDMNELPGFVCVVRVTNLDNQTYVDFSALVVNVSSGNLATFYDPGESLITARRAPSGAAIRMNSTSRYLFAIGGDDGVATPTRFSTIESAPVSPFGAVLDAFSVQRNELPAGQAFSSSAAAVVGRHVYLAGGRVGEATDALSGAVLRAYLLDPFEAPEITGLSFDIDETNGLDPGVWYYRVAPVMTAADVNNPSGEGLPSEPIVLQVPVVATGDRIDVELAWRGLPDVATYRVYRSSAPNQALGDELLLDEVTHVGAAGSMQVFVDDGTIDNASEIETPMPLGSLGTWHEIGSLTTAREGAAIVAVPDRALAGRHYLYVLGGKDTNGDLLDSIEWTRVQATGSSSQALDNPEDGGTVDVFAVSGRALDEPVWLNGAVFMDAVTSPMISGTTSYLYALPGDDDATGAFTYEILAFEIDVADGTDDGDGVDGNGSLGIGEVMDEKPSTEYGGYGYVANNNFIHFIGGKNVAPSINSDETSVSNAPPELSHWDAGSSLTVGRYLLGTAYESAFIFAIGGFNGTAALSSVEQTY